MQISKQRRCPLGMQTKSISPLRSSSNKRIFAGAPVLRPTNPYKDAQNEYYEVQKTSARNADIEDVDEKIEPSVVKPGYVPPISQAD